MKSLLVITTLILWSLLPMVVQGQDSLRPVLSGSLLTDQRVLAKQGDWAWNESRIVLNLDQRVAGQGRFHAGVWFRNLGIPNVSELSSLYNKGMVDPVQGEVQEAYVQYTGFLLKNLDLTIGRQRIAWGTADKLNPTDLLNPADLEDILDFGRRRGSDGLSLMYYPGRDVSLQAVYLPWFQPSNLPVGLFSSVLFPAFELPLGLVVKQTTDTVILPKFNLKTSATAGFRAKALLAGIDVSVSYLTAPYGLPTATYNLLSPIDAQGGTAIHTTLEFPRFHIAGVDFATSVAGIGLWGEAAWHIPAQKVTMQTDLSPFFPGSPVPMVLDSVVLDPDKPFLKWIVGADYHFADGSYLNLQFLHGFLHEQSAESLEDYLFVRYEKSFFREKLKVAPLSGALVVTSWDDIKNGYALAYMPEITYQVNPNAQMTLAAALFHGEGESIFAGLKHYDMVMLKVKYSF
jgi:hypothetical protein